MSIPTMDTDPANPTTPPPPYSRFPSSTLSTTPPSYHSTQSNNNPNSLLHHDARTRIAFGYRIPRSTTATIGTGSSSVGDPVMATHEELRRNERIVEARTQQGSRR